jgi:para-nitrobenzyl esterase
MEERSEQDGIRRREVLGSVGLIGAGMAGLGAGTLSAAPALAAQDPAANSQFPPIATPKNEIVTTRDGRVRGYVQAGIHTFKGIPYAAPTAGAARWLPPQPVKPWSGTLPAIAWGPTCPIGENGQWKQPEYKFLLQWDNGIPGEDCLVLNVWTPAINDRRKRPVMFWLHGGGFSGGSAQELPAYDGANLAKRGDVVVVSINHRLNAFGFLDLAGIGGVDYADSGNAGMLDVVQALRWVRDNVAGFGGDPDNVTIFGQSGGGSKVTALASSPMARGLFKRGIVQSGGGFGRWTKPEDSKRVAEAVLDELGMSRFDAAKLGAVRPVDLVAAMDRAGAKLRANGQPAGMGPVANGRFLPVGEGVPREIGDIPMIIGSNATERTVAISEPEVENLSQAELRQRLEKAYPGHGDAIVRAYQQTRPGVRPVEVWASAASWTFARSGSVRQLEQRMALGGTAPTYRYEFGWRTPVLDGRPRAYHCSELPFVFNNVDRTPPSAAGGAPAMALGRRMADAWIAFARSGNPNHAGIPDWRPVSKEAWPTMVFDTRSSVRDDLRSPEILALRATTTSA